VHLGFWHPAIFFRMGRGLLGGFHRHHFRNRLGGLLQVCGQRPFDRLVWRGERPPGRESAADPGRRINRDAADGTVGLGWWGRWESREVTATVFSTIVSPGVSYGSLNSCRNVGSNTGGDGHGAAECERELTGMIDHQMWRRLGDLG